ncbi:alpha/beta fold hydrolase [Mycobacterium kiyosense]|nr:hypothetical protein IWGMT90018_40960 [Mycobacterium kiyosense]
MTTEPTFVLVHAAWADSSSWAPVIHRLQQRGHNVIAAPLPLTSFDDDTAALNRVLERIEGRVVLGGHAYAGAVIGAANTDSVTANYVAAIAVFRTKVKQSPVCFTAPLRIVSHPP